MRYLHYTLATGLGLGYSPVAPGTAGSILAVVSAYFLIKGNIVILLIATLVVTAIGTYSSTFVENDLGSEDPSIVVIDEIAGMWISLIFLPVTPWLYLSAFVLFRLFDVVKPFPINSLQKLPGGWGIMFDDVLAGIYSLLILQLWLHFFPNVL